MNLVESPLPARAHRLDELVDALAGCRKRDAPVSSRGGETSLASECTHDVIVVEFSRSSVAVLTKAGAAV